MKNITVSVDDSTYQRARIKAAQAGRSVSALVRDYLNGLATEPTTEDRLIAQEHALRERLSSFRGADRLSREDIYQRGHEAGRERLS